jgi:hypothetical protein
MTRLPMSAQLENFLQYFRMFVTGSNLRDMVNNLDNYDLLCGTNKELFTNVQEYLYDFYPNFHGEVWEEIDMAMAEMKIADSLREKFEVWYSELDIEDDFEFIKSCFISINPEEFFGYGILSEIADTDCGIEGWDPQETASLKSMLEHWIYSKRRKDFLEKMAVEHIDALVSLSL